MTGTETAALLVLVLLLLGALVVIYWLIRLVGLVVKAPFLALRRAGRRNEPSGLGADYERLMQSQPRRGWKRPWRYEPAQHNVALTADPVPTKARRVQTPTSYRRLSWLSSIAISLVILALTSLVLRSFLSEAGAGLVELAILVLVIVAWIRVWRRYHAPLVNFIPKRDYERFVDWQDQHGGR